MTHAKNRELRETMYRANITRASSGDIDNSPLIEKVRQYTAAASHVIAAYHHNICAARCVIATYHHNISAARHVVAANHRYVSLQRQGLTVHVIMVCPRQTGRQTSSHMHTNENIWVIAVLPLHLTTCNAQVMVLHFCTHRLASHGPALVHTDRVCTRAHTHTHTQKALLPLPTGPVSSPGKGQTARLQ